MIDTTYAVNCLKQGFQRYIRSNRINATIDCGDNYVSFYVNNVNGKQYIARGSDHHLKMQHLAYKDKPWNGDNISIVFITPNSPQDIRIRGRVRQTHYGSIKPFSVTTYKYDNTILDERDLHQIFNAILSFLNGNGYTDPFAKTPKAASVIPINANIKPYKEPTRKARNISVDKDGNYVSANAWGADYVSENKQYKTKLKNMNKKLIRLNESDLHRIVKESVEKILSESDYDNFFDWAKNSNASPEEIEAAGQRHDSRIPSIYDDYDKLERRQKNNERYRKQIGRGYITPSTMRDYQKFDIKNDRSGGKMFTDRLMKGLIPKNFRN